MSVTTHKIQGYRGQLAYTEGSAVTIVAGLKEVTGKFSIEELDATDHGCNGAKDRMGGLSDFEGTAKLDYIEGDTSQTYLLNALMDRTKLAVTLFPEQASGQASFVGNAMIFSADFDAKTELEGLSITLKGCAPGFTIVAQAAAA